MPLICVAVVCIVVVSVNATKALVIDRRSVNSLFLELMFCIKISQLCSNGTSNKRTAT
jgi:hypothetical protein